MRADTPVAPPTSPRLARVAPHDAPQGGVRLEGRDIDPDRLPLDQIRRGQDLHDPGEHRPVGLHVDQPSRARNRRVPRRRFVEA